MTRHTLEHDGLTREYFVFSPRAASRGEPLPVLYFLHGYGGTATGTEAETTNGLNRYADEYGYLAVYPQGTWFVTNAGSDDSWVVSSWNDLGGNRDEGPEGPLCSEDAPKYPCPPECGECGRCGWTSCHDDVGFMRKLLDAVAANFDTDPARVFLAGFSNGSMLAQRLGCEFPERLAALALVGGRLERGYQCVPSAALPLLQINGGRDRTVPYEGAMADSPFFYTSAPSVAAGWAAANGCSAEKTRWRHPLADAQRLECSARCAASNIESINCLWPDGEHFWPGYPEGHGSNGYCVSKEQKPYMPQQALCVLPDTRVDVWGSRLMFDFFSRHARQ